MVFHGTRKQEPNEPVQYILIRMKNELERQHSYIVGNNSITSHFNCFRAHAINSSISSNVITIYKKVQWKDPNV